ncbi:MULTISPECIES: alpha/beta fold hydrolase [Halomonadaceae]|uniref:alpha/beta fold hydrolase n=1 Tax=Halomonadaceae TaxID=28256 RepID=UPI002010652C|nr:MULTISPECIES: alpha/beta hydrolase [Halomonas]
MQEHWIETPQGRVHAAQWGAAGHHGEPAPIVLLHDSLGCIALWRSFPAKLAEATGRQVIAYDRLGYGRSDPYPGTLPLSFIDDEAHGTFRCVRDALGFERFTLLGHSVGGSMAVVAAGHYPQACDALITQAAQAFAEARTRDGIHHTRQQFNEAGQMARLSKYHGEKAQWVLEAWADTWLSDAFHHWNLEAALPRVTCPSLVIHGELDEYGSLRQPERIAELTAGVASMEILANCGHVPHRECENVVVSTIDAFLASQADAPAHAPPLSSPVSGD